MPISTHETASHLNAALETLEELQNEITNLQHRNSELEGSLHKAKVDLGNMKAHRDNLAKELDTTKRDHGKRREEIAAHLGMHQSTGWDPVVARIAKLRNANIALEQEKADSAQTVIRIRDEAQRKHEELGDAYAEHGRISAELETLKRQQSTPVSEYIAQIHELQEQVKRTNEIVRYTSEDLGNVRASYKATLDAVAGLLSVAVQPASSTHSDKGQMVLGLAQQVKDLFEEFRMKLATVRDGLHWTGDGYEWSPLTADYREEFEAAINRATFQYRHVGEVEALKQAVRILREALEKTPKPHQPWADMVAKALEFTKWTTEKNEVLKQPGQSDPPAGNREAGSGEGDRADGGAGQAAP